jgi:chemotaxis response regulator CheB
MPKKALEMGAVEVVAPLNEIADKIIGMINM